MRIAYADPPYPGWAHLYEDHPDYAGEVDHPALIAHLRDNYDGWALSTSAKALRDLLPFCPDTRLLAWVKNTVRYAWEPVIVMPAREPSKHLRDWLHCEPEAYQWRPKPDNYVIGQKPVGFCRWVFEWLGARPGDELEDVFPGSGNVGRAWVEWSSQPQIAAMTKRESRRWRGLLTLDSPCREVLAGRQAKCNGGGYDGCACGIYV